MKKKSLLNSSYLGSIVLGLNDALVELTGAIAGMTFAFQNTKIITIAALITGLAAALSMAVSEYLSKKTEKSTHISYKSAIYTGFSYLFTVLLLIFPFILLDNPFIALILTILIAILVIFLFTLYLARLKHCNFKDKFFEMSILSMGVALISFIFGLLIRNFFGVDLWCYILLIILVKCYIPYFSNFYKIKNLFLDIVITKKKGGVNIGKNNNIRYSSFYFGNCWWY